MLTKLNFRCIIELGGNMYRTVEAIYKEGQIVPLEEIEVKEQSKLLVIVLDHMDKKSTSHTWKSLKGKYKNSLSTVDEFIARKQVEKKLEL
jgi:predicted DNA-binding antitoxin AbrB/MazE fold protein